MPHQSISPLFPTRRSSDLSVNADFSADLPRDQIIITGEHFDGDPVLAQHCDCFGCGFFGRIQESKIPRKHELRSEEHTSELQSREKLVCRLLLEKKQPQRSRPYVTLCACRTNRYLHSSLHDALPI